MLSNIKIGTKLFLSFALLIVMSACVGVNGWFGVAGVNGGFKVLQYFGGVSDKGYMTIIGGSRAMTAATRHVYAKDPEGAKKVTEEIEQTKAFLADITKQINEDKFYSKELHNQYLGKVAAAESALGNFASLSKQYEELQKTRVSKSAAFDALYLETGVVLGEILKTVDSRYKGQIESPAYDGDVTLHYFKKNKIARDCRGALTAFRISYDAYQLAIGEEAGKAAYGKMSAAYDKFFLTIKAFESVPFEDELAAKISKIKELASGIKSNLAAIAQTINEQNTLVASLLKASLKFEEETHALMTSIREIYDQSVASGTDAVARSTFLAVLIGCVVVVLSLFVAWVIACNITPGIREVAESMHKIASTGDLTVNVSERLKKRKDEIGALANSFTFLTSDFRSVEKLAVSLAEGNWDVDVAIRGEHDVMNIHLDQMLRQVNEVLSEVDNLVLEIVNGTIRLASASERLSRGAAQSASSIEQISASINDIGSQTSKSAENADAANKLAGNANSAAATGQEMMQKMVVSMQQITTNANDVQRVVKVIDDISFQTNLLALNAAVEAARAGSHGKGFAVVAEEVRNLAARSAKAAAETTQMISNNNLQIQAGADVAAQTADTLVSIVDQASQVADLIGKIANANQDQANAVSQVSSGLGQIENVIHQNKEDAENTATTTNEMKQRTHKLKELVENFHLKKITPDSFPQQINSLNNID
ncbi:MAG: methyl-accepting chemotaxis protein [Planctomycetaceae bacterium]|jgi:methyl-accepting chemotaxis protein|nr:methyl-accepting chemotaxis protein [Planctomycetaceae bacterium]